MTTPVGPFGFAGGHGYQEDGDSNLKLLGHRHYDPSTGRFLTRDPIQDGRNWYAYCDNNPLHFIDPTGHWFGVVLVIVIAAAALYYAPKDMKEGADSIITTAKQANKALDVKAAGGKLWEGDPEDYDPDQYQNNRHKQSNAVNKAATEAWKLGVKGVLWQ